jgi:hypothetical protein
MKTQLTRLLRSISFVSLIFGTTLSAHAAIGEMGTGVPQIGIYSSAVGVAHIRIWSLANAAVNFPAGCSSILISRTTVGEQDYKVMLSVILTAKSLGKPVRFYAHAERDGGCGADYVQLD